MKRHKFNNPILMWNCRSSASIGWKREKLLTLALYRFFIIFWKGDKHIFLFLTKLTFSSKELWDFSLLLNKQQQAGEEVRDSKKLIITIKTHIEQSSLKWYTQQRASTIYLLSHSKTNLIEFRVNWLHWMLLLFHMLTDYQIVWYTFNVQQQQQQR